MKIYKKRLIYLILISLFFTLSNCFKSGNPDKILEKYIGAQIRKDYTQLYQLTSNTFIKNIIGNWKLTKPFDQKLKDEELFKKILKTYPVNIKSFSIKEKKEIDKNRIIYQVIAEAGFKGTPKGKTTNFVYQAVNENNIWKIIPPR